MLAAFGATPVHARTVIDGNVITGGGVTAGIDFALALAAEAFGARASPNPSNSASNMIRSRRSMRVRPNAPDLSLWRAPARRPRRARPSGKRLSIAPRQN